jgi:hypothetical protein
MTFRVLLRQWMIGGMASNTKTHEQFGGRMGQVYIESQPLIGLDYCRGCFLALFGPFRARQLVFLPC